MPEEEFKRWYFWRGRRAQARGRGRRRRRGPGRGLAALQGCLACHSVDGRPMVGPTFKGLFGRKQEVHVAGRHGPERHGGRGLPAARSIRNPGAQRVQGYPIAMPGGSTSGSVRSAGNTSRSSFNQDPSNPAQPAGSTSQLAELTISGASTFTAAAGYVAALRAFQWGCGRCAAGHPDAGHGLLRLERGAGNAAWTPAMAPDRQPATAVRAGSSLAGAGPLAGALGLAGFAILLLAHG